MRLATNLHVIGRQDNILLVDFSKRPEPPAPRFPGAAGLRAVGPDEPASVFSRPPPRPVCGMAG
jgi:hypothetical protein